MSCYIWGTPADIQGETAKTLVHSARAGGRYYVTHSVIPTLAGVDNRARLRITDHIVEQNRLGAVPEISSLNLEDIKRRAEKGIEARAIGMLQFLHKVGGLGKAVVFQDEGQLGGNYDGMLAYTSSSTREEFSSLALYCEEQGWLKRPPPASKPTAGLRLEPAGYLKLEQLAGTNIASDQGFIAMWFDSSMDDAAKNGFAAGIEDAGYRGLRIDKKEHSDKIDDQIIAEIRRSRFVVADFTSEPQKPRGGVYFEAGFARGLGIPVIWTCRKDLIDQVHFDTRQFNHIVWETPSELRSRLATRISAVIGDGPHRKP